MTCPTLLKMASQGGANAIGHGDILGSVEEGKKADLILLNIDQPHITPTQNLVNTIVDAANGHDVMDSIINGKLVMKNREVLTLDEERIRFEATQHMNEIIRELTKKTGNYFKIYQSLMEGEISIRLEGVK